MVELEREARCSSNSPGAEHEDAKVLGEAAVPLRGVKAHRRLAEAGRAAPVEDLPAGGLEDQRTAVGVGRVAVPLGLHQMDDPAALQPRAHLVLPVQEAEWVRADVPAA